MFRDGIATACPSRSRLIKQLGGKKLADGTAGGPAQACRKYAQKYLDLQREQFKRIGVFGRWDDPYSTMTPQYESVVAGDVLRLS